MLSPDKKHAYRACLSLNLAGVMPAVFVKDR